MRKDHVFAAVLAGIPVPVPNEDKANRSFANVNVNVPAFVIGLPPITRLLLFDTAATDTTETAPCDHGVWRQVPLDVELSIK